MTVAPAKALPAGFVLAIDGPAGAGKSSVAGAVARRLACLWIDTGALYRGVALAAQEAGIGWDDAAALADFCQSLDLQLAVDAAQGCRLLLGGIDRSADIRTPLVSQGASLVARHAGVRQALLALQRRLAEAGPAVLEGRDIGTVVFPQAPLKVFLTASVQVRAQRRWQELHQRGLSCDFDQLLRETAARDAQDAGRPVAPLRPAADAVLLDASAMTLEEVVEAIVGLVRQRFPAFAV